MKKIIVSLLLAFMAIPAFADITTTYTHKVTLLNNSRGAGGYYDATLTKNGETTSETFRTFCLEYGEHFNPGVTYNANIDTTIQNSGANPDTLDAVTQKLYAAYVNGRLSTVANIDNAANNSSYSKLQQAFWAIESGDVSVLNWTSTPTNGYKTFTNELVTVVRDFSTNADTIISATLNAAYANIADGLAYQNVMVLNLWTNSGSAKQSQLYMNPEIPTNTVPAPGAVLLSGLGTLLVGKLRRRSL